MEDEKSKDTKYSSRELWADKFGDKKETKKSVDDNVLELEPFQFIQASPKE